MKKIKDLQEPYYTFARNNQIRMGNAPDINMDIGLAFSWEKSPEGFNFWYEIEQFGKPGSCDENGMKITSENSNTKMGEIIIDEKLETPMVTQPKALI